MVREGVSWCVLLSPASLCLRHPQILPYAHLSSLSLSLCLPARSVPFPVILSAVGEVGGPGLKSHASATNLQCGPEHRLSLYLSSLSSLSGVYRLSPTDSWKPWFFQGWLTCCQIQMRCLSGFLLVGWLVGLVVNLEI